jgi:hypothetical protein
LVALSGWISSQGSQICYPLLAPFSSLLSQAFLNRSARPHDRTLRVGVPDSGVTHPLFRPLTARRSFHSDVPPTRTSWSALLTSYARSLARSCRACWFSGSVPLAFSPACGSLGTNPHLPACRNELSQGFPTHVPLSLRLEVRLLVFRLGLPCLFTSSRLSLRRPRLLVCLSSSTRVSSHQPLA